MSERPNGRASYGGQTVLNLVNADFDGALIGVNPTRSSAHGVPCAPTLQDAVAALGASPDAVVLATPAPGVPALVDEAGRLGAGGCVVYAAGFAEASGDERGVTLQEELIAAAHRHEIPLVGPNGNGIVAVHAKAPMWGDAVTLHDPGGIAFITQSGNLGVNALALSSGPGFHTVVSGGNQAVVDAAALLQHFVSVDDVRVVALYLEADGDGPRLANALAGCLDAGKRVVVLKGGRSVAGRDAGTAHTAALAGDDRVFRALMKEAGAIVVADLAELVGVASALDRPTPPRRPGADALAIVTCSGGDCTMAADLAEEMGIPLAPLTAATRARLREVLPSTASVVNPLDHTNTVFGDTEAVAEIVSVLASDPRVGVVLAVQDQPIELPEDAAVEWRDTLEGDVRGANAAGVPVLVASTLPEHRPDLEGALGGLRTGLLAAHAVVLERPGHGDRLRAIAKASGPRTGTAGSGAWSESRGKALLASAGLPVPRGEVVDTPEDAAAAALNLGSAVAVKADHPDLLHKSDIGAVVLGLTEPEAIREAAAAVLAAAPHGARVLVEQMADPGLEIVVSAHRGGVVPVLVLGLGGMWAETLDDVALIPLPADQPAVLAALGRLRAAPVLLGARGGTPYGMAALARLAVAVGELLLAEGLDLIELNPVLVGSGPEAGVTIVDAVLRS